MALVGIPRPARGEAREAQQRGQDDQAGEDHERVCGEAPTIGKHPGHRTMRDVDADLLISLKSLADPNRLQVAGACAAGPRMPAELATALGMPEPAVRRHLEVLSASGLIDGSPTSGYRLRVDVIHSIGRRLGGLKADGAPPQTEEAKVIRAFFRDDRLTTIPSHERKRQIVTRYLLDRCFTEDRSYPEKEVNQRLALFHPDVATLRRAMVDEGLLVRANSVYRRPDLGEARPGAARAARAARATVL